MANRVEVIGVEELQAVLDQLPAKAKAIADNVIKGEAVDAVGRMVKEAPVDSGNLRRNITFEEQGDVVEVSSRAFNAKNQDYAPFVEFGTRFTRQQPYFWHNVRMAQTRIIEKITKLTRNIIE